MSVRKTCDHCGLGETEIPLRVVRRYGLSRQLPVPGKTRLGRVNSVAVRRERSFGGIDLCDPCWEKIGKPKQTGRRETNGTHP